MDRGLIVLFFLAAAVFLAVWHYNSDAEDDDSSVSGAGAGTGSGATGMTENSTGRVITRSDAPVYFVQVDANDVIEKGSESVISDLVSGGANTAALQVFSDYDSYGVYWGSKLAPVRKDILGEFVAEAHENNISVFAWMTTLDMPWVYDENPGLRLKAYDGGRIVEDTGWYRRVSPCSPVHREYIVLLFREIVADYDVEGILLQDDLYWGSSEVFDDFTKAEYFRDTGRVLTHSETTGDGFHQWKSDKITRIVRSLNDGIKSARPDVMLAVDVYAGCALSEDWCLSSFGQDYDALSEVSDFMAIMAYHALDGEGPSWVSEVAEGAVSKEAYGNEAIVKVQVVDWSSGEDIDSSEVKEALIAAKQGGAKNLGLYLSGRTMAEMGLDFEELG